MAHGIGIARVHGAGSRRVDENGFSGGMMTQEELLRRLELLRTEHRDLDAAIDALAHTAIPDQLQLARLKKRKLALKDEISWIEGRLIPDIIA